MPEINWNSSDRTYGTLFKGDDGLVVTFYIRSVQDIVMSRQQGVPMFKDVQYVKIFRAGELMNIVDRPIQDQDKIRFRHQWEQFQLNKTQMPEGTPIDLLFPNHPSVADTLKSRGIFTIQQCAGLTSHAIDGLGIGGQEYVNRAANYMDAAKDGKNIIAMQEDLSRKNQQINSQQAQIEELISKVRDLTKQMNSSVRTNDPNGTMQVVAPISSDVQSERIAGSHVTRDLSRRNR